VATRKTTDDQAARQAAADLIARNDAAGLDRSDAGKVVMAFDAAEFESVTTRAAGSEIPLRRVVLTGPWEVVSK
jgi:hypothetical protein